MEYTLIDDEGDEVVVEFPTKKVVCPECEGHGSVLRDGLRGHAFSSEEFEETFWEEEDRAEYFRRGGKYDQVCPSCAGRNVMDEIDESALTAEQKVQFAQWQQAQLEEAQYQRLCESERRMGC